MKNQNAKFKNQNDKCRICKLEKEGIFKNKKAQNKALKREDVMGHVFLLYT
jgi:hypothetical protein